VGGQREYAQLIVQETKRLSRLVDNLLAFSRVTDATSALSFEPLIVDELVREALHRFSPQLNDGSFEVVVDTPEDLPLVSADRTAMVLLLDNLIDNAIRYSVAKRRLEISARAEDSHVALEVRDYGQGIPQDELQSVTRKFFRGRNAGSAGTGLGLAIVRNIVLDHGGKLTIRSAVGSGTTVSVTLRAILRDDATGTPTAALLT
jgi:signal transduction histidine kinase